MRRPCNDCPWRRDSPAGFWDPTHFRDIWRNCQGDGLSIMSCHKAAGLPPEQRSTMPCQGWVRAQGFDSIGVRLAVMRGVATTEEVRDRGGPDLFSFAEMMHHNGVVP